MRYSPIHTPGQTASERAIRWLGRRVEGGFHDIDLEYADVSSIVETASIASSGYVFAEVSVPPPAASATILVHGFVNCYLSTGSAIDAMVSLEVGTAVVATARLYVASPGTGSVSLIAVHPSTSNRTCLGRVTSISGSTALSFYARGVLAEYIREG